MPKSSGRKSKSARRRPAAKPFRSRKARTALKRAQARTSVKLRKAAAPRRSNRTVPASGDHATDRALRDLLIAQLEGGHAHATLAQALEAFPTEVRGVRPDGAAHSAWQVLEHLRITQWDIVEFTRDPAHRSPTWPEGYWPMESAPPSENAWDASVHEIERELDVMKELLGDTRRELFVQVEHPEAKPHHTLAREAVVLAVHNGYHISELIMLRRLLGVWPSS